MTTGDTHIASVSVIIPTYNRLENLKRTIDGICAQRIEPDQLEILVVDNSSTDGTQEWAEQEAPGLDVRIRYFRKEPEGPAIARNLGIANATGEFALIMDSDVVLDPDWLPTALDAFFEDPATGIIGGKVLYSHCPERINAYGGEISRLGIAWDAHEGALDEEVDSAASVLWMNCSAMLVRTEVCRRLGSFDPTFFFGYEDSDFGWRVRMAGYRSRVLPSLKAYHFVGAEIIRGNPNFIFQYSKNRLRSMLKNYNLLNLAWILPLYLLYTCADVLVRKDKRPKAAAIAWNLRHLPDTWKARRAVQRLRTVPDRDILPLFTRRWFPPVRLDGMKRRPSDRSAPSTMPAQAKTEDRDFWS